MTNVVNMQSDVMTWVCECGCASFSLLSNGSAECSNCYGIHSEQGGWAEVDPKSSLYAGEKHFNDVHGNGSIEFAKARVGRLASDDDVAMVVVAKEGGSLHAWSMAGTANEFEWVAEKLTDARALMFEFIETHQGE